jgi:BCD family chlorophyll transporter-like MFS transporter
MPVGASPPQLPENYLKLSTHASTGLVDFYPINPFSLVDSGIVEAIFHTMKRIQLLRLGLFQMMAGALSVLFLGVLNRVMRIELGLDLFVVSLLVGGGHYLGALVAIPFGYFSDQHPVRGYRRSAYILLGALVAAVILVLSPTVARWLAQDPSWWRIILAFLLFFLEGIATYIAGTAFLSLIADRTDPDERGQATGLVWTLLMVGIIAAGVGTSIILADFEFSLLISLFSLSAAFAVLITIISLWGQERRYEAAAKDRELSNLRQGLKLVWHNYHARWFAAFLLTSMFSYFMQDVILEPFGGEVFGLGPAETTRFNAYMGVGVVAGMLWGGMRLIPQRGKRWVTSIGVSVMVVAFLGLAASSILMIERSLPVLILALGLGAGWFTVGGVALMMDLTTGQHTGLFIGVWTLIQAAAKGPTAVVGGAIYKGLAGVGLSPDQAYAAIFALEGAGLALSLVFLGKVVVEEFRREVRSYALSAAEVLQ